MTENRKKKSFVGIDYFRVVFALFVVFIHAFDHSTGLDSFFYYVFASIAVPWFLIVSGYFAYKSFCYIVNDRIYVRGGVLLKKSINIFSIYLVWVLFWMPNIVITYMDKYPGASLINIILLILRRIFIAGQGAYWYLLVLSEAILFLYILYESKFANKKSDLLLCSVIIIGMILGVLYDLKIDYPINTIFYKVFSWSNNIVMKGIPFVGLGWIISKYEYVEKKISTKTFQILCIGIFFLSTSLNILMFKKIENGVFFPIQAVSIFLYSKSICACKEINTKSIRNISSCIYLLHQVFLNILVLFIESKITVYCVTIALCLISWRIIEIANCNSLKKVFLMR